jgi:16S rRNA (guanine527-N7)-methyltransferase
MRSERIAELLHPFVFAPVNPGLSESNQEQDKDRALLSDIQLARISTYIDMLLHWNARINLTAIRDPEEIVTRHFGESLFAAGHLFPEIFSVPSSATSVPSVVKGFRVADVGTGAGFPGIPIKLWAQNVALTLIESNQKKAVFLREVVRALTLTDVDIQNERAETIPTTFDVVTLRAVERFNIALPTAAALVAPAGRLAILISSKQIETACNAVPTISWEVPLPIPLSESRVLLAGAANQQR